MGRRLRPVRKVYRGERLWSGKRYRIISRASGVAFNGTLVGQFRAEGERWVIFRRVTS